MRTNVSAVLGPLIVAQRRCSCRTLLAWSRERGTPITYDRRLQEFRLNGRTGYAILSYCPICGGRLAESKRPNPFGVAVLKEGQRVRRMLSGLRTRQELIRVFGKPDGESRRGAIMQYNIGPKGEMRPTSKRRTMIYRNILKHYDVSFFVGRRQDSIAFHLKPK